MAVPKLFENDDFIIINKPYDMYINSDNENETVSLYFLWINLLCDFRNFNRNSYF